jgi:tRNA(Ile)-lysidine synthase
MSSHPQPLEDRVARTIRRFRMIPDAATRVGAAVSGGADSVCLLRLLYSMGIPVSVIHVNHQLRGEESENDEAFVTRLAGRLGLQLYVRRVDTRALGGNLEQQARGVRYGFFDELVRSGAVDVAATGHTLSDQAETVLFRILRGTHSKGLAGVHPVARGLIRPLIEVTREEVESYLREAGDAWRDDRSNRDLSFARNRIRHELLPALKRDWNPEIERTLAHQAVLSLDEEAYWSEETARLAESGLFQNRGNKIVVEASKLLGHPVAVARRLVRYAIETVKGDLLGIDFRHTEEILELARQTEGHGRLQAPGIDVMRSFGWLRFAPIETGGRLEARNYEIACPVEGKAALPGNEGWLELEVIENIDISVAPRELGESVKVKEAELDLDRVLKIGGDLRLRTWKPGDQYSRAARSGTGTCDSGASVKVKQLFQDERIPLWDRANWPMITAGQQIVWVKQFGPAAEAAARGDTRRILRIREIIRDEN